MPQSFSAVRVHLVFSTKHRLSVFQDVTLRDQLHAQLGEISNRLDCPVIRVGGVEDHVLLLACLRRTISLADWVKELKRVSNTWVRQHFSNHRQFEWQAGYGAFGVSQSQVSVVIEYIENQAKHHEQLSFQDEFRGLLRRHNLTWDERYVWD